MMRFMQCVITAGPTYEPLDEVRRLTNFSSGRLGTGLGNYLVDRGHQVSLLVGEQASHRGERRAQHVEVFTTTTDLRDRLLARSGQSVDAVFHVAAVSDFCFGKVWTRLPHGELKEVSGGKLSTRQGTLLAELAPTPKILPELRQWFPQSRLVGWKYEVDGDRQAALRLAERQIVECLTDACVLNGPAYGEGFALVCSGNDQTHLHDVEALYRALEKFVTA
jgi:phosphopantothenoylcysteine synthetase/decarboxylase